jgi:hypothetical protein
MDLAVPAAVEHSVDSDSPDADLHIHQDPTDMPADTDYSLAAGSVEGLVGAAEAHNLAATIDIDAGVVGSKTDVGADLAEVRSTVGAVEATQARTG